MLLIWLLNLKTYNYVIIKNKIEKSINDIAWSMYKEETNSWLFFVFMFVFSCDPFSITFECMYTFSLTIIVYQFYINYRATPTAQLDPKRALLFSISWERCSRLRWCQKRALKSLRRASSSCLLPKTWLSRLRVRCTFNWFHYLPLAPPHF